MKTLEDIQALEACKVTNNMNTSISEKIKGEFPDKMYIKLKDKR